MIYYTETILNTELKQVQILHVKQFLVPPLLPSLFWFSCVVPVFTQAQITCCSGKYYMLQQGIHSNMVFEFEYHIMEVILWSIDWSHGTNLALWLDNLQLKHNIGWYATYIIHQPNQCSFNLSSGQGHSKGNHMYKNSQGPRGAMLS